MNLRGIPSYRPSGESVGVHQMNREQAIDKAVRLSMRDGNWSYEKIIRDQWVPIFMHERIKEYFREFARRS